MTPDTFSSSLCNNRILQNKEYGDVEFIRFEFINSLLNPILICFVEKNQLNRQKCNQVGLDWLLVAICLHP